MDIPPHTLLKMCGGTLGNSTAAKTYAVAMSMLIPGKDWMKTLQNQLVHLIRYLNILNVCVYSVNIHKGLTISRMTYC